MRGIKLAAGAAVVSVGLAGCVGTGPNQAVGAGVGTVAGATAGAVIARSTGANPIVGALIGGVAGGIIGGAIGAALDDYERQQLAEASRRAAGSGRVGQRIAWTSGGRGKARPRPAASAGATAAAEPANQGKPASGYVIPTTEAYTAADGRTCRDLQQVAEKDGKTYEQKVTACKTGSGWDVPV